MRTLNVDFDGVLNSYTSGWDGVRSFPDPPAPGAIEWLTTMVYHFDVWILSSRFWDVERKRPRCDASEPSRDEVIVMMEDWLETHGMRYEDIRKLSYAGKPPGFITLDDRGVMFAGEFPSVIEILSFKPWNR